MFYFDFMSCVNIHMLYVYGKQLVVLLFFIETTTNVFFILKVALFIINGLVFYFISPSKCCIMKRLTLKINYMRVQ